MVNFGPLDEGTVAAAMSAARSGLAHAQELDTIVGPQAGTGGRTAALDDAEYSAVEEHTDLEAIDWHHLDLRSQAWEEHAPDPEMMQQEPPAQRTSCGGPGGVDAPTVVLVAWGACWSGSV